MIEIRRQWPGATLFTNGLLYLDPCALLQGQGWDPAKLDENSCRAVVTMLFDKLGIDPVSRMLLCDPGLN